VDNACRTHLDGIMKRVKSASIPLPSPFSFTVEEALRGGLSYSRLRRADLTIPSRGVRLVNGSGSSLLDEVAPLTRLGCPDAASHSTAARLWGIILPFRLQEDNGLHLTRWKGSNRVRRPGVIGHRAPLTTRDVVEIYGVTVTSPAWTWTDLASALSLEELVAAGDSLLRRQDAPRRPCHLNVPDPLSSLAEITSAVERRGGSRGIRLAREALPLLRSGVDSGPESRLRLLIVQAGLTEPEINQWILDRDGRRVSRPDLMYRELRIAIEYEGEHHLVDADQWHRDINRDDRLRRMGWTVLRFTRKHLEPAFERAAIQRIRDAIESAPQSNGHL
jgi:hypothetical protein